MSIAVGRRIIIACLLFVVLGLVILARGTAQRETFLYPSEGRGEVIVLNCVVLDSKELSQANADQAYEHFLKQFKLLSEDTAGRMQAAMETNDSTQAIRDLSQIEKEDVGNRRELLSQIERKFGCAISLREY